MSRVKWKKEKKKKAIPSWKMAEFFQPSCQKPVQSVRVKEGGRDY
jgi:hypothetical protein